MGKGITGWRLHIGTIMPTPVPPRFVREFYEMAPDGVDITTFSLNIQKLADGNMDEALSSAEQAAKLLSNFDVDMVYLLGVPPIVRQAPDFDRVLADRLSQACGLPALTDITGVMQAMRSLDLRSFAMATPFEESMNEKIQRYLRGNDIDVVHMNGLGIQRNTEIRRLPIPVEYTFGHETFRAAPTKPDGLYIPCGGWGSVHNIELLERDLDTTVITWMNAFVWSAMKLHGVKQPIKGFGKLLASI